MLKKAVVLSDLSGIKVAILGVISIGFRCD